MYRTTLGDIRPIVALVRGICSDDTRIPGYVNDAQMRLQSRGRWVSLWQKYRICTNDACITWPRQIETIEMMAMCQNPGTVRNEWFEFLENGPGLQDTDGSIGLGMIDRGMACTFSDPQNTTTVLRVYADNSTDVTNAKTIRVFGLDQNGNEILALDGTPGELMTLANPYVQSTHNFWKITGVQRDATLGYVRMYGWDTVALSSIALAVYEPSETRPLYRRSFIPGIQQMGACCGTDPTTCAKKSVTVMAKLRYIPAVSDLDWLIIGNIPAMRDMIQSLKFKEDELFQQAQLLEMSAINELEKELKSFQGDGEVIAVRMQDRFSWGGGGIGNLVGGGWLGGAGAW